MDMQEEIIKKEIESIIQEFEGYGYRRVTKELNRRGMSINHKKVKRIMRVNNLQCRKKKRFVVTTDSTHQFHVYPKLTKGIDSYRGKSGMGF